MYIGTGVLSIVSLIVFYSFVIEQEVNDEDVALISSALDHALVLLLVNTMYRWLTSQQRNRGVSKTAIVLMNRSCKGGFILIRPRPRPHLRLRPRTKVRTNRRTTCRSNTSGKTYDLSYDILKLPGNLEIPR